MKPETLDILVALGSSGEPPSEFRIFTKGEVKTRKGSYLFDDTSAKSVMQHAADFGAEYPLDYGHAMLGGGMFGHADPAAGNKAAGWFKPELRKGELWATDVTWTPTAAKMLREREYRYVSPAFNAATDVELEGGGIARRIEELINVALTNVPATKGLTPLVLATDTTNDPGTSPAKERTMATVLLATLAAACSLSATASEADILARVGEHRDVLGELGRATGKDKPREAIGVALAWKAQAEEVGALRARVTALDDAARKTDVERKVQEKIDAHLLSPAQRDWAVKLGVKDGEMLDGFLAGLTTKVVDGGPGAQPTPKPINRNAGSVERVSDEYLSIAGLKREDFERSQKLLAEKGVI